MENIQSTYSLEMLEAAKNWVFNGVPVYTENMDEYIKFWKVRGVEVDPNVEFRDVMIRNVQKHMAGLEQWDGTIVSKIDLTYYGNYYIAAFKLAKENSAKTSAYVVLSEDGIVLEEHYMGEIVSLDSSNYVHTVDSDNRHYKIKKEEDISRVWSGETWKSNAAKVTFVSHDELLKKGLLIVSSEYEMNSTHGYRLYSFVKGKYLTQGLMKIETKGTMGSSKIIDFVKEAGCLKVTLVVTSNVPGEEKQTNEIIGLIDVQNGLLRNGCLFNITTNEIYKTKDCLDLSDLEQQIKLELNKQVEEKRTETTATADQVWNLILSKYSVDGIN